ncbi:MAG: DNA replication/repair protein RecF [Alphaproteobacteria bacterium]
MAHDMAPRAVPVGAAQVPAYFLRRLTLTDFRCYAHLRLETDARCVVLTGPNGAGKTNILEAISYLSPGRGLRRARLADVCRTRSDRGWAVAGTVDGTPGGDVDIGTGTISPDPTADAPLDRRQVRIAGETVRGPAALAESVAMAWITPQMDRLFQEDSASRRRFLDRLVYGVDPGHATRVAAYERAMRERAHLLKSGRRADQWVLALENTMAEYGVAIAAARRDAVNSLSAALHTDTGPFPAALVEVDGSVEASLDDMAALDAEQAFREALTAARYRDAETGGAAVGPHRSDLAVTHLEKGLPARQCSTGEQKALLIAIVLADARVGALRTGAAPLLLLDEIVAHLDENRRHALFAQVLEMGVQAWLTGTDKDVFEPLGPRALFLDVSGGTITGIQND